MERRNARVLIAEDDRVSRLHLEKTLRRWGYEVLAAADGEEAWRILRTEDAKIVVTDWMMPGLDGLELCRRIRSLQDGNYVYLILLTAKAQKKDLVEGMSAGADDFITKPFDVSELKVRIQAGERVLRLKEMLSHRVQELEEALAHVRQLQGLLPICAYCKKIRDDENYWHQMEQYIASRTDATFSHGVCPSCFEVHVRPMLEKMSRRS